MSGIAIAASTMPGSVATFWSCSSERSRRIAARISSSAKIRAGTRMSARASAEISYRVSSIRRGSELLDIEHDARLPHAVPFAKLELVIGRGLHDRLDLGHASLECGAEPALGELDACLIGDERVGVREVDELVEKAEEKAREVAALHGDTTVRSLTLRRALDEPAESVRRFAE